MLRRLALALSLLTGSGCAQFDGSLHTDAQPLAVSGYAVAIGGALRYDNTEVWSRLVELAGGPGARFVVFATASAFPDRSAALAIEALQRHGAVAEHIAVAPRLKDVDLAAAVRDPALIEKVRSASGVYFVGGAQGRITDTLLPGGEATPLLDAIWQVYRNGGVVAGSSAGAAIMSTTMFRDARDVMQVLRHGLREGHEIDRGLGFVGPELFVDQHFLRRGRIGRMLPLMLQKGYRLGIGVEENSAAIVHNGEIEVIGAKGVLLADLSDATVDATQPAFNLRNARLSYLDHGDRYRLRTRIALPSPQRLEDTKLDAAAAGSPANAASDPPFYPDILGDSTIVDAMAKLLDPRHDEARGLAYGSAAPASDSRDDLGFEFRLRRTPDSRGWCRSGQEGEDCTVLNVRLDVAPVVVDGSLYKPLNAQR